MPAGQVQHVGVVVIDEVIRSAHRQLIDQQEAYLLDFFGSLENARKFAHLYVLESNPLEIIDGQEIGNYSIRQEYRLRLKTDDELAADRARENDGSAGDD